MFRFAQPQLLTIRPRMDYEQEYISHEYVELKVPVGTDANGSAQFLLDPNHLHIWPRHSFMLIALPNKVCTFFFGGVKRCRLPHGIASHLKDKTFTSTLFAPTSELQRLTTRRAASIWFKTHFPDVVDLIGEETLLDDFLRNPRSSLISLKVFSVSETGHG